MKDNYEIKVNGELYVSSPEPSYYICAGCAFDEDADVCDKASNMQPSCSLKKIIWVKKDGSNYAKNEGNTNTKQEGTSEYYTPEELVVGGEYDTFPYGKVKLLHIKQELRDSKYKYVCIETDSEWVRELSNGDFKLKKKVDWSKVPVDTKIIVKGVGNRHFAKQSNTSGYLYYVKGGATSWSNCRDIQSVHESEVTLA